eukprot:10463077-Alexandrium_andersonii.AAC.1
MNDDSAADSDDAARRDAGSAKPVAPELWKQIRKLHGQTGRRPPRMLARALAIAGAPAETARALRQALPATARPKHR